MNTMESTPYNISCLGDAVTLVWSIMIFNNPKSV